MNRRQFLRTTATAIHALLPILATMLILIGVTSILMGLLAEIMVRTYYESQGLRAYHVRKFFNFEDTV